MITPANYEHDVFLSYVRETPTDEWVQNHFFPELRRWLNASGPRPINVFIDVNMKPPAKWPATIKEALLRSRYMVAVVNPPYFTSSAWCRAEWETMCNRENQLGLDPKAGLIYSVLFTGLKRLPENATARTYFDFTAWNVPGEGFEARSKYENFVQEVQNLANLIIDALDDAPPFDPGWTAALPTVANEFKIEKQRF